MTLSLKHKKKNKSICAFCGYTISKRALHIHHIDGNHNNNDVKNLIVVCANCHAEAHEKQKMRNPNMIIDITTKQSKKDIDPIITFPSQDKHFPITQKERERFKTTFPQHTELLERCIKDGDIVVCESAVAGLTDIEKLFIPMLVQKGKIRIVADEKVTG